MNFAQKLVICSFIFIIFLTLTKEILKRKLVYNAEYGIVDCGFEP